MRGANFYIVISLMSPGKRCTHPKVNKRMIFEALGNQVTQHGLLALQAIGVGGYIGDER